MSVFIPLAVTITSAARNHIYYDSRSWCNMSADVILSIVPPVLLYYGAYVSETNVRLAQYNFWTSRSRPISGSGSSSQHRKGVNKLEELMQKMTNILRLEEEIETELDPDGEAQFQARDMVAEVIQLQKDCMRIITSNKNMHEEPYMKNDIPWLGTPDHESPSTTNPASTPGFIAHRSCINDGCGYGVRDILLSSTRQRTAHIIPGDFTWKDLMQGITTSDQIGTQWDLNIFQMNEKTKNNALFAVGWTILRPLMDSDDETLQTFLITLGSSYLDNMYHNQLHGAQVAHHLMCLTKLMDVEPVLEKAELAAIAIAALGHDVGHPGRNNNFFVQSGDSLAVVYNDKSVLENYHAFLTFDILSDPSCNVFADLPGPQYRMLRKHMIDLILATDMVFHFGKISSVCVRRYDPDFDHLRRMGAEASAEDEQDLWTVMDLLIKTADIGHATLPWREHSKWCGYVIAEFFNQGDEERRMGIVMSPLCDRNNQNMPKSQHIFIEKMVLPLLEELNMITSNNNFHPTLIKPAQRNRTEWIKIEEGKGQESSLSFVSATNV
eukprot:GHVO01015921.1.p1 GENE.GHVO01015921.1~~GHVO01015921.1.p1  ORF type:complete len:616 (-),score=34.32 GHVO01015921.1:191-1846(-)